MESMIINMRSVITCSDVGR